MVSFELKAGNFFKKKLSDIYQFDSWEKKNFVKEFLNLILLRA